MLDHIDLQARISKEDYREQLPHCALTLRDLQFDARESKLPIVIVLEGWDGAGIGDAIAKLGRALDPRHVRTHSIFDPTPDERMFPFLWRFWKTTPRHGKISIYDRSWNQTPVRGRNASTLSDGQYLRLFRDINEFERQLSNDGTLIIKLFLHISAAEQKKRFKKFENDPYERWRVTRERWKKNKEYPALFTAFNEMLENTSTAEAPWDIIAANQRWLRRVSIFRLLIERIDAELRRRGADTESTANSAGAGHDAITLESRAENHEDAPALPTVLDRVDLSHALDDRGYQERLAPAQVRLRELLYRCYEERTPVAVLLEGWDAAGKGGTIKRVVAKLDPRSYAVIPVGAPTERELEHPFLWRFWRDLPKAGHLAIFDRSWYGRVLVERVEGLCTQSEWQRAYREINELERQLVDYGMVMVKFWLHISKDEQLRRFQAREQSPLKRHKLTEEDHRNRERWEDYRAAASEMLARTSTTYAPWTIIENEDKRWGRVRALETINRAIEERLGEAASAEHSTRPAQE